MEKTNITTEELKTLLVANNFDAAATAEAISKVMPLEVADIKKIIEFVLYMNDNELGENEYNDIAEEINALFTYDVYFDCEMHINNKGFKCSKDEAISYVDTLAPYQYEGYEGGMAMVICNQTEEIVYKVDLPDKNI